VALNHLVVAVSRKRRFTIPLSLPDLSEEMQCPPKWINSTHALGDVTTVRTSLGSFASAAVHHIEA